MIMSWPLTAQQQAHFTAQAAKYDSTFTGIGPKVYFLPPPKSEEEVLDDRYAEKEIDSAVVEDYLNRMEYYHRLKVIGKPTELDKYLPLTVIQASSVEGELLVEIDKLEQQGKRVLVADLQNRLGMEYLALGASEYALEFFQKAMAAKQTLGQSTDRDVIAHNLAVTHEYRGELDKAFAVFQELHRRAVEARSLREQGYALMELAYVKAIQGSAAVAQRDIIRKVVPMFRRAKHERGRASAYRTLADIYALQQKYPEAQWFLLQAKTIVDKEGIADQLPKIIFDLAENKKHAGNPRVAIEEYKVADDLARKDHIIGMQLAIQDALGNLYHEAGDYDGAAAAIKRYDTLKNQLFKGEQVVEN